MAKLANKHRTSNICLPTCKMCFPNMKCLKKLVVEKRASKDRKLKVSHVRQTCQFRQAFRKNFRLSKYEDIIYHFKARGLEISNIQLLSRNIQISRFYEHFKKFREICFCSYFREICFCSYFREI